MLSPTYSALLFHFLFPPGQFGADTQQNKVAPSAAATRPIVSSQGEQVKNVSTAGCYGLFLGASVLIDEDVQICMNSLYVCI